MLYKEYGNTGKKVSALGFGGMRFDVENNSIEVNAELVRKASELGINYFDTAPGYCNDKSELIFGTAFTDMPHS
ncbi:MAG: aldo/keto reductase, partial [Bacillota bacterium]